MLYEAAKTRFNFIRFSVLWSGEEMSFEGHVVSVVMTIEILLT